MPFTAAEIARQIGGEVVGDANVVLQGFSPAEHARAGDLTFAENEDYFVRAEQNAATAIIANHRFSSTGKILIACRTPALPSPGPWRCFFPSARMPPAFIPRLWWPPAPRWTPAHTSGRIASWANA